MAMEWILAAASLGAGIVAVWGVRRRRFAAESGDDCTGERYSDDENETRPIEVTRNQPSKRAKLFYGVTVQPGMNSCKAVEKMRGRRYLTHEAPKLPLPECRRSNCQCRMIPEDDRRTGFDRRGDTFSAFGDYNPLSYFRRRKEGAERRDK
jgi:hypothetical protein